MEGVKVTQSGRSPTQLVPAGLYTQKRDRASGGELSRDGDKTNSSEKVRSALGVSTVDGWVKLNATDVLSFCFFILFMGFRMALPTRRTWVWASSGSCWWTGKPGELQSMGLQRVRHDWVWWNDMSSTPSTLHIQMMLPGTGHYFINKTRGNSAQDAVKSLLGRLHISFKDGSMKPRARGKSPRSGAEPGCSPLLGRITNPLVAQFIICKTRKDSICVYLEGSLWILKIISIKHLGKTLAGLRK